MYGIISSSLNIHSIIVLIGGVFILYTATREILHMMNLQDLEQDIRDPRSVKIIITWIVAINLIFSFDSILSAMALSDVFWVMALAIIISGVLMIWLADRVSEFLQKNRMYEVLGLFILFVVGIMLLSEGGHLAHLHLFGHEITPMSKATFYFVIGILVLTDIVQTRYQKKLMKNKRK
jgi:predicted tellurium resistance membrane protein TerC